MNSLWKLLKINILHTFNINAVWHQNDPKERLKLGSFLLLMIFVGGVMCGYSYFYFSMLAPSFAAMNMMDSMIGTMMAMCSFLILFTSLYKVVGLVIGCKDYDMLSSLPIKNGVIMISKWATLYFGNLLFLLIILIPGIVVYQSYVLVDLSFYLILSLLIILLPLLPLTIGCLVGIVIRFLSSRFKYSNILTVVLSCGALMAYMYTVFQVQSETELLSLGTMMANMLNNIYPLTSTFIGALCNKNILDLVFFFLINVVSFGALTAILAKNYGRVNNALLERKTKGNYVLQKVKSSGVFITLLKKELKRYFASSIYVMNTAVGILLQTMAIVYFALQGQNLLTAIPIDLSALIGTLLPIFICVLIGMSSTTACSISMEGKQLWIMKTLPIRALDIFFAKICVNIIIALPLSIINTLLVAFVFDLAILDVLLGIIIIIFFTLCVSMSGIICNLLFPNFTWESETRAVKQSASVMLQMLFGVVLALIPGICIIVLEIPYTLYGFLAILIILAGLEYVYLKNTGSKIFYRL